MTEPKSRRVALVTGASAGLGRSIAATLAEGAAAVAVHYRSDRAGALKTAAAVRAAGAAVSLFRADLLSERAAAGLVRAVEKRFGRLDILVNNVGPILMKPWDRLTAGDWDRILRANLIAAHVCMRSALPGMRRRRWGRIVNIGYSRAEQLRAFPGILPYAAAKTGLLLLTRTAAAAEAAAGITVNMVSPGLLKGGLLPRRARITESALGTAADAAAAIRFLVSEEAARTSGTNIIVAGTWKM